MRYLIISDIHGNLEALQAVLGHAKKQGIDRLLCLGDVIGFGANPNECIELVKAQKEAIVLMGNHEAAVSEDIGTEWASESVKDCIEWTKKNTSEIHLKWMKELPKFFSVNFLLGVHGTPNDPLLGQMSEELAKETLRVVGEHVTVCGHIHRPHYYNAKSGWIKIVGDKTIPLKPERIVIVVPSVGKPKDGDNRAGYAILDFKKMEVYIRRVSYDFKKTQKKMAIAGLPENEINGLETGQ